METFVYYDNCFAYTNPLNSVCILRDPWRIGEHDAIDAPEYIVTGSVIASEQTRNGVPIRVIVPATMFR